MKKTFTFLSLAVTLAACSQKTEVKTTAPAELVSGVTVEKVAVSAIPEYYEATGTVRARTTTDISSNIMGTIVSFPVTEGDHVSKGQVLARIDARDAQTRLDKAQAALAEAQASLTEIDRSVDAANAGVKTAEITKQLAETTLGRYKVLAERKSVSPQEFDEVRTRYSAASSELERARANVQTIRSKKLQINAQIRGAKADIANTRVTASYSVISSPVDGVIVKKMAEQGSTASPGTALLTVEDSSQYRLEVPVEESHARLVHIDDRVLVNIDAIGKSEIAGRVAEVLPSADAASRSVTAKIDLPADAGLRSGLYGSARFAAAARQGISIPATAVVERGQLSGVFVVSADGIATFRIVTLGFPAEGALEVLSGLSEGENIVTEGADRVKDGAKVR